MLGRQLRASNHLKSRKPRADISSLQSSTLHHTSGTRSFCSEFKKNCSRLWLDSCLLSIVVPYSLICGAITLPGKNTILTYHHLFRQILLRYGLFDQIRMDCGQEFFLKVCLKKYWFVNQRVNYPNKRVLITLQIHQFFNFDDPVMKCYVSWVTMYSCQDALQQPLIPRIITELQG